MSGWWLGAIGVGLAAATWWAVRGPLRRHRNEAQFTLAVREFHRQREPLEAKFVQLAGSAGKPRGLRWVNCDFEDEAVYARDKQTADLCAFVGVAISFEAIEGGGMEDVEAVSNVRAATSVFRFQGRRWTTDGRAIFNLSPHEAIAHFQNQLTAVGPTANAGKST